MTIKFGDFALPKVVGCQIEHFNRKSEPEYTANGDMLIDLVVRKYRLTIDFEMLLSDEVKSIMAVTDSIFFPVRFTCPKNGTIVREFHVENQPMTVAKLEDNGEVFESFRLVLVEK